MLPVLGPAKLDPYREGIQVSYQHLHQTYLFRWKVDPHPPLSYRQGGGPVGRESGRGEQTLLAVRGSDGYERVENDYRF